MKRFFICLLTLAILCGMSPALATTSQNECKVCHSTGIYTCRQGGTKCPDGSFCPICLDTSFGYQPKCSTCKGSGKESLMGQKVTCSHCLGKGETILDFQGGYCENCRTKTVCEGCLGNKSFSCPFCNTAAYEKFVYNRVMRDSKNSIGKLYFIEGMVVATQQVTSDVQKVMIQVAINDSVNSIVSVLFNPLEDLKVLLGDEVTVYGQLIDVDEMNSLPRFFSICAAIAGYTPEKSDENKYGIDAQGPYAEQLVIMSEILIDNFSVDAALFDCSSLEAFCQSPGVVEALGYEIETELLEEHLKQYGDSYDFDEAFAAALAFGAF